MPLTGQAKAIYMPEYRRRPKPRVATCSFCGEAGSSNRLLVGDQDCIICEECITLAVARIAEARGRPARQQARPGVPRRPGPRRLRSVTRPSSDRA